MQSSIWNQGENIFPLYHRFGLIKQRALYIPALLYPCPKVQGFTAFFR